MASVNQFTTFKLDQLLFGVEVNKVQEVIRYQEMTRVPLASPVVQGLINLRGQIVAALDLTQLPHCFDQFGGIVSVSPWFS
jgi:purine-binding chemotaxis protein CheW